MHVSKKEAILKELDEIKQVLRDIKTILEETPIEEEDLEYPRLSGFLKD